MDSFPAIEIDKVKAWDFRLANINTSECLNVAYGVDANYLDGVGVSITSIVLNNRHINLDFILLLMFIMMVFFKKLQSLQSKTN